VAYIADFRGHRHRRGHRRLKIFDKCTPGHLNREILEHRNIAAAIIAGAVILGVCIIVAAAMLG